MNIDYNAVMEILKNFLENEKTEILGISVGEERQVRDAIRNLLTAYEKEKEKNKELNRLKGFEMLDIFNMGKQSSRQRIEFDYVDKEKIKAKIEEVNIKLENYGADKINIFSGQTYMEKFKLLGELYGLQSLLEKE